MTNQEIKFLYQKDFRKEFLLALRRKKSQEFLSKKMGFRYNKVFKWENSKENLYWSDFCYLCKICGIDLKKALHKIVGYSGKTQDSPRLFLYLMGAHHRKSICVLLNTSSSRLTKILTGNIDPHLEEIFILIAHRGELFYFIRNLIDIDLNPTLKFFFPEAPPPLKILADHPEMMAVGALMSLPKFNSLQNRQVEFLSESLDIPKERILDVLVSMEKQGYISKEGKKYVIVATPNLNTGGASTEDYTQSLRIKRFWIQEALRISAHDTDRRKQSRFTYVTFACSEKVHQQISERVVQTFVEIRELVSKDTSERNKVGVVNFQILHVL